MQLNEVAPYAIPPHYDALAAMVKLVMDAVSSPQTRRSYAIGLAQFHAFREAHNLPFTRYAVHAWRISLEQENLAGSTINVRLAAVRKLAREAAANGLLDTEIAAQIEAVQGIRQRGQRMGNWLNREQAQRLINAPAADTLKGKRDRALLALLVGCGLRRSELAALNFEHIQQRDGRWLIVDLRGKGGRIRTVPMPAFVKAAIDCWSQTAEFYQGRVMRSLDRKNGWLGESLSEPAIWKIAAHYGEQIGVTIQPHDLRRTCAKLCRRGGGELEQIQLLLGHASVQTTERYLGTRQDLENAPNDRLGLKWKNE